MGVRGESPRKEENTTADVKRLTDGLDGGAACLLRWLHKNGPATKKELTERLGIPLTTLNRRMQALADRGLAAESGTAGSSGGRRPVEFDVNPAGAYAAGVDLSRSYVQTTLMDFKCRVLGSRRFAIDAQLTPRACAARVAQEIGRLCSQTGIGRSKLLGIGVGTVGPMDRAGGTLLFPHGFPGTEWEKEVPLSDLLRRASGLPCVLDNGANCAALLESAFGAGRGARCLAYVQAGVGIRSAVVRDGGILRTPKDAADALARMAMDPRGGCLEDYVTLVAVCRQAGYPAAEAGRICGAAAADAGLREALSRSARILGLGLANLDRLLSPDRILLGGPLVTGWEAYFPLCLEAFAGHSGAGRAAVLRKGGDYRENAVAAGAALSLLEEALSR